MLTVLRGGNQNNNIVGMSFTVLVYTGDRPGAGTDANIRIRLHDESGTKTPEFKLDSFFRNDFERGNTDDFNIKLPCDLEFGCLKKIEFWRDSMGVASSWYLDRISVIDEAVKQVYEFPIFRWIRADHHYIIQHLDTSLPQFDEQKEQRLMELVEKKELYKLKVKIPGLPAQIADIPEDEEFATDYRWDMKKLKYQLAVDTLMIGIKSSKWKTLETVRNLYTAHRLPEPKCTRTWMEDSHFGNQRVAGVNPILIRLCTHIPNKFGVTDEMVGPFLEGLSLQEAINQKRLFIVDLEIMENVPCQNDTFVVCAPVALFFEDRDMQLLPVAIQLFQNKGPDNPVFLPSDPPLTWLLAKMWYNNADSAYHQALTHLGFTHLIMEGISVITHRNLSQTHPIFKLLAPHFLYLIAINTLALRTLISEGGWVDSVEGVGIKGTFFLIAKGMKTWRMDVEGTIPEELSQRGLLNDKVLSFYPYRDDVILLYEAISSYVTKIVDLYYDTPDKLSGDQEIQAWAKELVTPKEKGGCGILGVPGNGHFTSNDQLTLVLTSVISTCSVLHGAFNFPQYENYAFPPNYPLMLKGAPPKDKKARTEKDVIKTLPDKTVVLDTMLVVKLLSAKGTNSLGDFEVNFAFDPKAMEVIESFKVKLSEIKKIIEDRNKTRRLPYEWLDPENIPNSISI